ncbi:hypothetical protein MMC28_002112 [Mycoblastus sanguinarius]|nr:hypothetical protein [Mycoblastus sanguinarius]
MSSTENKGEKKQGDFQGSTYKVNEFPPPNMTGVGPKQTVPRYYLGGSFNYAPASLENSIHCRGDVKRIFKTNTGAVVTLELTAGGEHVFDADFAQMAELEKQGVDDKKNTKVEFYWDHKLEKVLCVRRRDT